MTQTGVNSNYGRVLYGLGISPEDIRDMESCFAGVPGLGKLLDNPAVSRKHARFFLQDGQCSVADQKSTNRTYVNDCALEPQVAQLLRDGDRIRLANEDFTFVQEG